MRVVMYIWGSESRSCTPGVSILGFKVWVLGFGVNLGFGVWGLGFRIRDLRVGMQGLGVGVRSLESHLCTKCS
jgi:hypothetical protein